MSWKMFFFKFFGFFFLFILFIQTRSDSYKLLSQSKWRVFKSFERYRERNGRRSGLLGFLVTLYEEHDAGLAVLGFSGMVKIHPNCARAAAVNSHFRHRCRSCCVGVFCFNRSLVSWKIIFGKVSWPFIVDVFDDGLAKCQCKNYVRWGLPLSYTIGCPCRNWVEPFVCHPSQLDLFIVALREKPMFLGLLLPCFTLALIKKSVGDPIVLYYLWIVYIKHICNEMH